MKMLTLMKYLVEFKWSDRTEKKYRGGIYRVKGCDVRACKKKQLEAEHISIYVDLVGFFRL